MPRDLAPSLITEYTRLDSDHVITFLLQVVIQGAPGTLCYALYDQDVVFHGLTFTKTQAQVEQLEDATSAALVHLRITVQNITQEFQSLAENYWVGVASPLWQVTVWQIDAQQPDLVPLTAGEAFVVDSIVTDLFAAVFTLTAEGLSLGMVLPKRRYGRSGGFDGIPQRI